MSLLPAFLDLRQERALVVGGGGVALRRVQTLLSAGMTVTVVAPQLRPELAALPVTLEQRPYRPDDVAGARVVVAATDQPAVNDQVAAEGQRAGAWVNHAGEAERGQLRFAAVAEQGGMQVAVSSGRELPMLTQALTERIRELLPSGEQVDDWTRQREQALTLAPAARQEAMDELRRDIRQAIGVQP